MNGEGREATPPFRTLIHYNFFPLPSSSVSSRRWLLSHQTSGAAAAAASRLCGHRFEPKVGKKEK